MTSKMVSFGTNAGTSVKDAVKELNIGNCPGICELEVRCVVLI